MVHIRHWLCELCRICVGLEVEVELGGMMVEALSSYAGVFFGEFDADDFVPAS